MNVQVIKPENKTELIPTIFLHGFPGIRSKQNLEIAEGFARASGAEAHVLFYSGLTRAPGNFTFNTCLDEVHQYVESLVDVGVQAFNLVGHSWGGFLSLTIAQRFQPFLRRMVLMSPLVYFWEASESTKFFEDTLANNPEIQIGAPSERGAEFEELGLKRPPDQLLQSVSVDAEVLFLQAREDNVTPTSIALEKLRHFPRFPIFELVDTDHSFILNRERITRRISAFLATGV